MQQPEELEDTEKYGKLLITKLQLLYHIEIFKLSFYRIFTIVE